MLHPNSLAQLSYTTVGLMEDIWHKRHYLRDNAYFVFRLEALNFETDRHISLFVHYLVTEDRWYSLISEEQFEINLSQLKSEPSEGIEEDYLAQSWRHYAFCDVVSTQIKNAFEQKIETMKIDQFTIWDTFPAASLPA